MALIYTAYVIKAILHTTFIYLNSQNSDFSKISMTSMDYIINMYKLNIYNIYSAYYSGVVIAYFIFRQRPDECFNGITYIIFNINFNQLIHFLLFYYSVWYLLELSISADIY